MERIMLKKGDFIIFEKDGKIIAFRQIQKISKGKIYFTNGLWIKSFDLAGWRMATAKEIKNFKPIEKKDSEEIFWFKKLLKRIFN